MNIQEIWQKHKLKATKYATDELYVVALIILVGFASFGLGRLSVTEEHKTPVVIKGAEQVVNVSGAIEGVALSGDGRFVASKNSTKYHFPWCSGAQRIKDSNKIWFKSKEEAEQAGYTPAGNCKGL